MITADHYIITETLHKGATVVLYRGVRRRDGLPVIIKTFQAESPAPREVERLRREYVIEQQLSGPYVIKPFELETQESRRMLVFKDFGGEPLSRLLGAPMETGYFLDIAIRLAAALADIHGQGIVHKDVKPENILIHPRTGEVKLIDFGIASPLARFPVSTPGSTLIEGSPAYMSPEQTGRMNRGIDHRSDLYSLGVTFYEMLTGVLPCQAADPLEWVHCHIAREPKPPHQIVPSIPEPVAAIVEKLLAKQAEERYQSARGLQLDLERCRGQWASGGRVEWFPLGERDISDLFLIPQKLYGREEQVASLLSAFGRVMASGGPEFMLVSGYSGIGKSSLVRSLPQWIVRERGYFISGKFEQYRRDIPYATISQAFRELIRQVLTESDERVRSWREALRQALGVNGRLIVDIIPQVELIIGPQPPVPELPPTEARGRFHMVFQKFMGVFAKKEHPLVLFLDDLQWLDPAGLRLIAHTITHPDTRYLFLLGAYRDNEVSPSHPLMITLDEIRKSNTPVREIVLGPLTPTHLEQLVADTVHRPVKAAAPLARLVHSKTGGNPFFAIQFLATLHQEGLLAFDARDGRWQWDLAKIRRQGFTDNVAELMVGKLKRFSAAAQEALKLAACVGNSVEVNTLVLIRDCPEAQIHADLMEAVNEGLLLRLDDAYRFLHDRVREAAYALIPEEERAALHLRIGRLVLSCLSAEEIEAKVFDLANQFNLGATLITEQEERIRVAALNLRAARRARASTAYRAAVGYLAAGAALLGSDLWEQHHDPAFALYLDLAECELLSGAFGEAERYFPLLLRQARTRIEKGAVYRVKIDTHNIKGEGNDAIESALECLRMFGIEMSAHPSTDEVRQAYEAVWSNLGARRIETLIDLPLMTDPEMQAAMEILSRLYIPAYYSDNNLFYLHICHGVNLSLRHGNSPASTYAYGWFGVLLATTFHRPRDSYRFARLAYDLMERHRFLAYKAKANMHLKFVAYWTQTLDKMIEYSRAMFDAGLATGDVAAACFSWSETLLGMTARGDYLPEIKREAERGLDFVQRAGFRDVHDLIVGFERFVQAMRGRTRHLSTYDDDHFSEAEFEAGLDENRMPTLVFYYHAIKLMARFLSGDFDAALASGGKSKSLLWAGLFSPQSYYFTFYYALTLAAVFDQLPADRQKETLDTLAAHEARLREWAENNPPTFQNAHALVRAEIARITGKELEAEHLYEQAIESAHEHGFVQNEGLGNELAARFYRARGLSRIADLYLHEARACYARWGADGKVRQLDRDYPHLVETHPLTPTATFAACSEELDLLSVIKASQSISREILLPGLPETLMRLVLEQAGAQRGFLLLGEGETLAIHAQAEIEGEKTRVNVGPALPVSAEMLPMSILGYVRRTGEAVVLADAAANNIHAADTYIARRKPKSVLCLPIVRQAHTAGLLYLENNLTAGAFTQNTLTALELLAAQAAISLESAWLYSNLQQENAERRRVEEELRRHREHLEELVAERTTELAAAKAKAEEADHLKSTFLATMSHELRTPLNSIIGFTGIMLQGLVGPLNEEQQLQMNMVKSSGRHLLDLINDILDLSKIEAGQVELRLESFDMRALIEKTVQTLRPPAEKKKLKLGTDTHPGVARVFSDQRRVEQILINLVNNAIKFTERGQVYIKYRVRDGWLLTSVVDTGIGIKPEDMTNLFTTFRQLDSTLARKHEGTGLGLTICKKLVNLLGGEIRVESAWGIGSTFTFSLPLNRHEG